MKLLANLASMVTKPKPAVGTTKADVIHRENKWRLLRYRPAEGGPRFATPVLRRSAKDFAEARGMRFLLAEANAAPIRSLRRVFRLMLAPADPLRVGDANRNFERLNIPWRFGALLPNGRRRRTAESQKWRWPACFG